MNNYYKARKIEDFSLSKSSILQTGALPEIYYDNNFITQKKYSIELLPTEILFKILENVHIIDLVIFATTSKYLRDLLFDDLYIWKKVVKNNLTTLDSFFNDVFDVSQLMSKFINYHTFINIKFINNHICLDIKDNINNLINDIKNKYNLKFKNNDDLNNLFILNLQNKLIYSPNTDDIEYIYNLAIDYGFDIIIEKIFYMTYNNLKIEDLNTKIKELLKLNHNKLIKFIIDKYEFPIKDANFILRWAAKYGNIEILQLLLDKHNVKPEHHNNLTLHWAIDNNHIDIVKILLQYPNVDVTSKNNLALFLAVQNDNFEMTKFLLNIPDINPSDKSNRILNEAIKNNNIEIIKLLLNDKRIILNNDIGVSIAFALDNNFDDICELIFNDKRINKLDLFKTIYKNY